MDLTKIHLFGATVLQHSGLPWHQGTSHIGQLPLRQAQQNPDQGTMVYHT